MVRKKLLLISMFLFLVYVSANVFAFSFSELFTGGAVSDKSEKETGFFARIISFFQSIFLKSESKIDNKTNIEINKTDIVSSNFTSTTELGNNYSNAESSAESCILPPECSRVREMNSLYSLLVGNSIDDDIITEDGRDRREYNLTLEGVDEGGAFINVDGTVDSVNEGDRERINGVDLYVCDVNVEQNWAVVAVCSAQQRQYICEGEENVLLSVGESSPTAPPSTRIIRDFTLTLLSVEGASVWVDVNGQVEVIDEDQSERVNGLEIYVRSVFWNDAVSGSGRALLVIGC